MVSDLGLWLLLACVAVVLDGVLRSARDCGERAAVLPPGVTAEGPPDSQLAPGPGRAVKGELAHRLRRREAPLRARPGPYTLRSGGPGTVRFRSTGPQGAMVRPGLAG